MCSNCVLPLILLSLAGAAFSASIKGGVNGTKGRWEPPKDWDWSVTPGRLIPVSEATDDLPTPGYQMPQLQQRIPPHHEFQPFPIMNLAVTNSTAEEKVVVIGQGRPLAGANEPRVTNQVSTTQRLETTENIEQSTPKDMRFQSTLDEQELILLQDEPIVDQRETVSFENPSTTEKVPVVEEPMKKVKLPEICSISGMGCRDPKPIVQQPDVGTTTEVEEHTEILKHPKVVPHPHVVSHPEVQKTENTTTTEQSPEQTTLHSTAIEEHSTNRDQLPSDSHHIDEHVMQEGHPIIPSSDTSVDESLGNNSSVSVPSNETNSSQETVTLVIPHFNLTIPTVVHSVISSVSEHIGYSNSTKHETDSNIMVNATDVQPTDSQHVLDNTQIQIQQQEQEVQQEQFYFPGQLSQEAEVHQVDEQKLLERANSWGSSSENSSTHSSGRRMDEAVKEEKQEDIVMEVSVTKEDVPNQEAASTRHEMKEVTHPSGQNNSTESPSLGDRLESYWKAATGYVSKALNL